MTKKVFFRLCLSVACTAALTACTTHDTLVPDLAGPSELATSVRVTATPDSIVRDGFSQTQVVVIARDPNGAPIPGIQFRLATSVGSWGTFSTSTPVTGSDGRAVATFTPPAASVFTYGAPPTVISIYATAIGTNYQTASTMSADVQLLYPAVPAPTAATPLASVTFTPATPKAGDVVLFDASASQAVSGQSIASYYWDFGDGGVNDEHGWDASHIYTKSGKYTLIMGVTDSAGQISRSFQTVTVN